MERLIFDERMDTSWFYREGRRREWNGCGEFTDLVEGRPLTSLSRYSAQVWVLRGMAVNRSGRSIFT